MKMKLELVPLPVADVERSIAFYADKLGFTKDVDVQPAEGVRIVQLTAEGSGCSIGFGTGLDVYRGEPGQHPRAAPRGRRHRGRSGRAHRAGRRGQ